MQRSLCYTMNHALMQLYARELHCKLGDAQNMLQNVSFWCAFFWGCTEYVTKCFILVCILVNGPFPSCFEPHYESEAKCKVFIMKISFHSYANKFNFHMKSFVQ